MHKVTRQQRKTTLDNLQLNENPDNNFKFQSKTDQIFFWISQWDSKQVYKAFIFFIKLIHKYFYMIELKGTENTI